MKVKTPTPEQLRKAAARREKELEAKFSELERVWERYNVYEKQGGA